MIPGFGFLVLLLVILLVASLLFGFVFFSPRIFQGKPENVLILAAHPDDCAIMAGEYAIWAAEAGRQIQIVYLTCGDSQNNTPRAKQRRQDAITAWSLLKVPSGHLHFLDWPQSALNGPVALNGEQAIQAREAIADLMGALPADTAVFIPAEGELHPDHRTLREIGLQAWQLAQRPDLKIYEVSEYNAYYSLLRCPLKTLDYMAKSLPLLGRWMADAHVRQDAFIRGGSALRMPPNEARLNLKCRLLETFRSENSELLVRYFGHPDLFRQVASTSSKVHPSNLGYVNINSRHLDFSVMGLWLTLYLFLFWLGSMIALWLDLPLIAAAIVGALLIGGAFRVKELERRGVYLSLGAGLLSALLAMI